jgi:hypothetical protein
LITFSYVSGGQPILIHDCWFYQNQGSDIILSIDTNRGVIWNCSVNWSYFAFSNSQFLHMPLNPRTEVWSTISTFGMADTTGKSNFYVEDCDFHGGLDMADFDSNSKAVWRHNVMDHAALGSHGYDTSAFGNRQWEVYNNQFLFADVGNDSLNLINHIFFRSGTGVITDNYFEDINSQAWGDKQEIQFGVWCLGRWGQPPYAYSADDGCVAQYPAPRQFGFGRVTGTGVDGQGNSTSNGVYVGDSEPAYIWNNTGFTPVINITTDGTACVLNAYGHIPDDPNDYIQAGRDYFVGTAKPGYTKYTYPHPLTVFLTGLPSTGTGPVSALSGLSGLSGMASGATPTPGGTPTPTPTPTATPTPTPTATPTATPGYLVNQNFEGTGYDNGETWTTNGQTVDPDYTGLVLLGSQSLEVSWHLANWSEVHTTYAGQTDVWAFCMFQVPSGDRPSAGVADQSFAISNSSGTILAAMTFNNAGTIALNANGADSSASATASNDSTTWRVWLHYVSGGTCELFMSTTTTRPSSDGSGNVYLTKTGAADTATRISCQNGNGGFVFDHVLVSVSSIGSNP